MKVARDCANHLIDVSASANVDAHRRLVQYKNLHRSPEAARDEHLLLISTTQRVDRNVWSRGSYSELRNELHNTPAFGSLVDQDSQGAEIVEHGRRHICK